MIKLIEKILENSSFNNLSKEVIATDVSWKTQDSKKNHILFYKLNNSQEAISNFKQRIQNCEYAIVITNESFNEINLVKNIIVVSNWLEVQKIVMDEFYPLDPTLNILAVTGTNGKTTTVDLMSQIATFKEIPNISIGTLGVRKDGKLLEDFGLTTPSFIDLRKYFFKYAKQVRYFFIEASSHALEQERFYGLKFKVSGWTSFSQDHLDYHETMDEYFKSKLKILKYTEKQIIYVSSRAKELVKRLDPKYTKLCTQLDNEIINPFFKADHNMINLEVAVELLKECHVDVTKELFNKLTPPPGRFNILPYKDNFIVIDFAHTPDAIENICKSLKSAFKDKELVTLFGCGGDRDRSKRAQMGLVAQKYSDKVVITSDNPRFEDPQQIINDILSQMQGPSQIEVDRKIAIERTLKNLKNSVLLIAGKGHENYIDINGKKISYSDEKVVKDFIKND